MTSRLIAFYAFVLCIDAINYEYDCGKVIHVLLERLDTLDTKVQQIELHEMEAKQQERQREESMQREIRNLRKELLQQQNEIKKLATLRSVKSKWEGRYFDKPSLEDNRIIETDLNESEILADNVQRRHSSRFIQVPTTLVAFSTYLSHPVNQLGLNQVIKYDGVITNEGNAYNSHTGTFTCPMNGLYLISFFTAIHGVSGNWIRLMVDDISISNAVSRGLQSLDDHQGGNVAILRLTTGQSVWTEVFYQDDANLTSTTEFRHVTFSGVRLGD